MIMLSEAWLSPQYYVRESDFIGVVHIAEIHEASTPEGIRVRSAKARVEETIFRRFNPIHLSEEDEGKTITLYEVDPITEISVAGRSTRRSLLEGRCLVLLKAGGGNKFVPFAELSVQKVDDKALRWPTVRGQSGKVSLPTIINHIRKLIPPVDPKR